MKIIRHLSEQIECEIEAAEEYARCALEKKEEFPAIAQVYYKIANNRLSDMNALHSQVVAIIEEYNKKNGEPPQHMKLLYEILHNKHIKDVTAVKSMLSLYSEM